jgi:glycosyltransferase involved in cell wall biosynthesis
MTDLAMQVPARKPSPLSEEPWPGPSVVLAKLPSQFTGAQGLDPEPLGDSDISAVELTVVIPFYNPGATVIYDTVATAMAALADAGVNFEILAVSDGSSDGSEDALAPLLSDSVRCLRLPENAGKGRAVREGLQRGRGDYLGFIDGDGDIPPSLLVSFTSLARQVGPALIVGSKRHPKSTITYPRIRWLYSRTYQSLVKLLFGLSVRDTQVGIKLIRRDAALRILPMMSEDRFAFDLELLALARHLGYDDICEAPVRINARNGSTISLKVVLSMISDTMAIFWRLKIRRSYDHATAPETQMAAAARERVLTTSVDRGSVTLNA